MHSSSTPYDLRHLELLIARVLRGKYFPHGVFPEARSRGGASWVWKSLLKGREI
ncbi:conserved hypothetical protein [Ricinus communis]|uniref:Uncharacterized protein n=1 Tax=Ricinus communis TaxID=3988 RepID=B9SNZ5_RICCO|nr:conserved hypothetical protein [Ricinus communis]